jgi:ADP-ribose pyrophosphatase YjhB (NUDIX family)
MEKIYKSEKEFLENYDSSIFEKPSVTADIVIFSISSGEKDSYRRLSKKKMSVLLVKRDTYPFKDKWCLPGGFVGINETIDNAALRILANETNLHNIFIEQLYTFGSLDRDPRTRVISVSYVALIDKNMTSDKLNDNASWFDIDVKEDEEYLEMTLDNGEEVLVIKLKKVLQHRTTDKYNYEIINNTSLAFDHPLVIATGITRIKNKLEYTNIVFNIMPEQFTLGELQQVYEVILGRKLLDPAFRRIIADKVEKTGNYQKGEGHRPSALFKFKRK